MAKLDIQFGMHLEVRQGWKEIWYQVDPSLRGTWASWWRHDMETRSALFVLRASTCHREMICWTSSRVASGGAHVNHGDIKWPSWRLGLPVNRGFVQQFVQTDNKETSKVEGNPPVDSPHKGTVPRKTLSFDYVIMCDVTLMGCKVMMTSNPVCHFINPRTAGVLFFDPLIRQDY